MFWSVGNFCDCKILWFAKRRLFHRYTQLDSDIPMWQLPSVVNLFEVRTHQECSTNDLTTNLVVDIVDNLSKQYIANLGWSFLC